MPAFMWENAQKLFDAVWKADGGSRAREAKKRKYTPEYRKHVETWVGYLNGAQKTYAKKSEPRSLDADEEAAWCALQHEPAKTFEWWLSKMGGAFLIRAFSRMWAVDWYGIERHNYITETDQHAEFPVGRNGFGLWNALRTVIAGANAKEKKSAQGEAESIRKRAPLALRIAFDFAFPNEHAWADDDADAHLAAKEANFDYLFTEGTFGAALLASGASREKRNAIAGHLAKWGGRACGNANRFIPIILAQHGEGAVTSIATLMTKLSNDTKKDVAAALATVPNSVEVARVLAAGLEDKSVRSVAQEYLLANGAVARGVLEELVAKRGKVAEAASHVLAHLVPTKKSTGPVAKADALPRVLATPPWASGKKKPKLPSVEGLKELPYKESIQWKPGERESSATPAIDLDSLIGWNEVPKSAKPRSKEMDAHIQKKLHRAGDGADFFKQLHYTSTFIDAMSDKAALAAWNEAPARAWGLYPDDLLYVLVRFDTAGIAGWLRVAEALPQKVMESLEHIDSPRVAPFVADTFRFTKRAAATAKKWLVLHAEPAAIALIPLALQKDDKKRNAPCAALRAMPAEKVRAVAKKYGEDARIAVDAILAFDPLDDYPDKLPKLPDFFDASRLPAPVLASGGALPPEAVTAIATMLAFSHPLDPYPGLAEVKHACDARSLSEFAWALFQEWMLADAPSKHDWALMALGHFGDDEIARKLAPKIREWPGEGGHARAVKGLEILSLIGSDVALMHLDRIAQKLKFKGLQEKARGKMQEIAEARGLTPDELGDRIAPTLDLDDDGSKTFEVGGKKFRVGFDADLKPTLRNEDGKVVGDLPKPSAPEWKALKKDAKTVAASQIFRLERAMCTKRTWTAEQFREFFVVHPLVSHLARRLVWSSPAGLFRVAEDRTYANDRDETFALKDGDAVTLPHRLALDDATITRWSQVFAEYEIIQPFPQLARDTYAPDSKEKTATAIARFEKTKVPTGRVLHLEDRGWRRGSPQDAGWIWDMRKDLGGGVFAELSLGGGILAGDMRESPPEQDLGPITLTSKISALDPIAFSELVRDVVLLNA